MNPLARTPLDLGRLDTLDPFHLEPGVILWDRFCIVGPVRHVGGAWSVAVSDLQRELGRAPHHRLELQWMPLRHEGRARLRRAVVADAQVQTRVHALMEIGAGMALLAEPVQGSSVDGVLSGPEAAALAVSLSGLLVRLHDAGVEGVRFHPGDLRRKSGRVRLRAFDHLVGAPATHAEDVLALLQLLLDMAGDHLGPLAEPPPTSARDLWDRARTLHPHETPAATELLAEPPFVGRKAELERLLDAFSRARVAQSSVVLVRGPRGVGKTRLLQEFGALVAQTYDAYLLDGEYLTDCGDTRSGLAGALDALAHTIRTGGAGTSAVEDRLRRSTAPFTRILTSFAPALTDVLGEAPEPPPIELDEQFVRHAAVIADAIASIGTQARPLVLLLENLESADRGSLAVLQKLARFGPGHHFVAVLSDRGEEPAIDAEHATCIDLDPLDAADLERCLDSVLPGSLEDGPETARALHDASSGFPLAACATIAAWVERGVLTRGPEHTAWHLVEPQEPQQVRDLYVHRLERVHGDQRELALLAAVRGGLVGPDWLAQTTGWDRERLVAAIDGLVLAGLMLRDDLGRLRFVHGSVRELVIDSATEPERQRAHRHIAEWLAQQGPETSAAQRAYHLELSLEESDAHDGIAALHLAAGHEMLHVYDLERARWHFEHALKWDTSTAVRVEALEGAADAAVLGAKVDEATSLYLQAVESAPDRAHRAEIAAKGCHALYAKAAESQARDLGMQALNLVGRPLRRSLFGKVGSVLVALVRLLRKEEIRDADLANALCRLYPYVAAASFVRDPPNVVASVLRSYRLARELRTSDAAFSRSFFGGMLGTIGWFDMARRVFIEAEDVARESNDAWSLAVIHHMRANAVEMPAGDYDRGQRLFDEGIASFQDAGDLSIATLSWWLKVVYGRNAEPLDRLHQWLDEATRALLRQGIGSRALGVNALRLLLDAWEGEHGIAARAHEISRQLTAAKGLDQPDRILAHTFLCLALVEAGDLELARVELERATIESSKLPGVPEVCDDVHLAAALLELAIPDRDGRGRRRLRLAIRRLRKAGRRSKRFAAAAMYVRFLELLDGEAVDKAAKLAGKLIATHEHHRQTRFVVDVHRRLSMRLRGQDVLAAAEHERLARELAGPLSRKALPERVPLREDVESTQYESSTVEADDDVQLDLDEVFRSVTRDLTASLGRTRVTYESGNFQVRAGVSRDEFAALIAHLALTVRDATQGTSALHFSVRSMTVDQERAARLARVSAGEYVVVECQAPCKPGLSTELGGLNACHQLAARLGGFVETSDTDHAVVRVSVCLPVTHAGVDDAESRTGNHRVVIVHSNQLVRRTLIAALTKLGVACEQFDPTEFVATAIEAPDLILATAGVLRYSEPHIPGARCVELCDRNERGVGRYPVLRVPFAIGELEHVLAEQPAAIERKL